MRQIFISAFFCLVASTTFSQTKPQISYFQLQDVQLLESPFKHAQDLDKQYLLELNADRLLAPFLREAGLTPKAESYTNWENTGLDGHIGGHYLSALSHMYASTGDAQIKARLDYMLHELKRVQEANGDGYIGGVPGSKQIWNEIASGNIKPGAFSLNNRWVPLYNIHKTYAGLRDAYLETGSTEAKEMLIKMSDWMIKLVANLSDEQIQFMLRSEHGGLNETFADVAAITGNEKYLKLAHQFSHQEILTPLLEHKDELTGKHANTQIPKVLGFKRVADVEGNNNWSEAARFFWEVVVKDRSVSIGGNSISEHFNATNDFSRMITSIEGPETCNTYNMLRLSKMLFQGSLDKNYIDYYERALYNHILSSQNPRTGGLVYFTQMRPGHYRVYSQPQTSMWCCVGSGIENHAKYGEMIYAYTDKSLYVNLFIPSTLSWKAKNVEVIQENNFPEEAKTQITINAKKATTFTLKLRKAAWLTDSVLKVSVNGKEFEPTLIDGYVSIKRKWKSGDKVVLEMPMHVTVEQMPDKSNYYSYFYGPLVLAAKTGTEDMAGLFADDSRGGHIAHGKQIPLSSMPIIVGEKEDLTKFLQPIPGKPLNFKLTSYYPYSTKGYELSPFYGVHESRYIIYWPQADKVEFQTIQEKIAKEENERIKLDTVTLDKVVCGEQQPESDHFIKDENSQTGYESDLHWREAKGWFSYEMRNRKKMTKFLYIKYIDSKNERKAELFVNSKKITDFIVADGQNGSIKTILFEVPASERAAEKLTVMIKAPENSITPRVAEVRLLSAEP